MDLKINREIVPAAQVIFDGIQEQTVELDYILPDYYPDIFRLIRCQTVPVITGYSVSGDKLSYELRCDINILYCGEGDSVLRCVTQRQSFSRTVDLGAVCEAPEISLKPKTDYVNFRAVNKRRLDVRGAVSVKISVSCEKQQEVISDVSGMNIQVKKMPVRYASKKICLDKTVRISEETELSQIQPPIMGIISSICRADDCEKKMISGKLLAKGEASVEILYACEKEGRGAAEPMKFSLPYSQIIDIDEIDETFDCTVTPVVISCDITPSAGKNGENTILKCEIEIRLMCRAVKTSTVMLAADAYSTVYPCETSISAIRTEQQPVIYTESRNLTARLGEGDTVPETIYAMWCTPKNINTRAGGNEGSVVVSGMLTWSMAAMDRSGMIIMPDRDEAFEETLEINGNTEGCTISADVNAGEVSYNISSEGVLTAKAGIDIRLSVSGCSMITAITDLSVDDSVKKERDGDYSIKLYYGAENEEIWDIAKKYSTSATAVMEENELDGDRLKNGGMLLIPIIN
ncbi:MAG: DUF3794 domain-containing protein [Ruminococcus sp.]|nr:DUF3794 domain-containing protein [Ruminococcus sp.]